MNEINQNSLQAAPSLPPPMDDGKPSGKPQKSYVPVEKNGEPVSGLYRRGDAFYGQLRLTAIGTGKRMPQKVALGKDVTTIPQAVKRLAELKAKEAKGEFRRSQSVPTFGEFKTRYLAMAGKDSKSMAYEKGYLNEWEAAVFGPDMKLDKITETAIRNHIVFLKTSKNRRTKKPLTPHSINVRVYALRSLLKMAHDEKRIARIPMDGIKKLHHEAKKKEIPSLEDIEKVVNASAEHCPKSGVTFADYMRLLMYSGMREQEALSLQWNDVDFTLRQVRLHRGTKRNKVRFVPFIPKLEAHLKDMHERRKKDLKENESAWLFPSPRPNKKGEYGQRISNFRQSLEKAREKVGIYLSEHYLRHYYTSQCVMAGVPISALVLWLGHADGGKLIANTYGHLTNSYHLEQAAKVTNI